MLSGRGGCSCRLTPVEASAAHSDASSPSRCRGSKTRFWCLLNILSTARHRVRSVLGCHDDDRDWGTQYEGCWCCYVDVPLCGGTAWYDGAGCLQHARPLRSVGGFCATCQLLCPLSTRHSASRLEKYLSWVALDPLTRTRCGRAAMLEPLGCRLPQEADGVRVFISKR